MTSPMLQLDENGDLDFSEGGLRSRSNVRQRLITRLRSYQGEWFLDTDVGTPWFQRILGKGRRLGQVTSIFRKRILETEGVLSIEDLSVDYNPSTRKLTVTFTGYFDDAESGQLVQIQV